MKRGVRIHIVVFLGGLFLNSTFAKASDGRSIQASGLRVVSAPVSPLIGLGIATATDTPLAVTPTNVTPPELDKTSGAASGLPTAEEFAQIGEAAFKGRDYKGALRDWRHSLVDDPENGVLMLNHFELLGPTSYVSAPKHVPHAETGPISLQFHGDAVKFRNIWVREFKAPVGRRTGPPFNIEVQKKKDEPKDDVNVDEKKADEKKEADTPSEPKQTGEKASSDGDSKI